VHLLSLMQGSPWSSLKDSMQMQHSSSPPRSDACEAGAGERTAGTMAARVNGTRGSGPEGAGKNHGGSAQRRARQGVQVWRVTHGDSLEGRDCGKVGVRPASRSCGRVARRFVLEHSVVRIASRFLLRLVLVLSVGMLRRMSGALQMSRRVMRCETGGVRVQLALYAAHKARRRVDLHTTRGSGLLLAARPGAPRDAARAQPHAAAGQRDARGRAGGKHLLHFDQVIFVHDWLTKPRVEKGRLHGLLVARIGTLHLVLPRGVERPPRPVLTARQPSRPG